MHKNEQSFFSQLLNDKKRLEYLLGRAAAKNAIYSLDPCRTLSEISIQAGIFGQPIIYSPQSFPLQVSISHTNNLGVAIAFSESTPLGIDIEDVPTDFEVIAEQLTTQEKNIIQVLKSTNEALLHGVFWTAKEAISKIFRTGITTPLEIYELTSCIFKTHFWHGEFKHFSQYQFISFMVADKICSIVYPKQIDVNIDFNALKELQILSSLSEHAMKILN